MTRVDARIRTYRARIEPVLDRCLALPEPGNKPLRPLVLNVEGHPQWLGKSIGADAACRQPTYPSSAGLDGARAFELRDRAITNVAPLGARAEGLGRSRALRSKSRDLNETL
jgi:hypothetical protein